MYVLYSACVISGPARSVVHMYTKVCMLWTAECTLTLTCTPVWLDVDQVCHCLYTYIIDRVGRRMSRGWVCTGNAGIPLVQTKVSFSQYSVH